MEYKHPDKYAGEWLSHESVCRYVEDRCVKCDKFMGKDHDFYECRKYRTKTGSFGMALICGIPDSCKRFQDRAVIQ